MKKSLIAALALMAASSSAQALVEVKAGYNYLKTNDSGQVRTVYGNFEHFVPLIPNAAVRIDKLDADKLSFTGFDASGYYTVSG